MSDKKTVLVLGATGLQGGAVARQLIANGFSVRGLTRRPGSAPARSLSRLGAKIVQGDLDDAASIEQAIDSVWGVFSVQEASADEIEQGKRIVAIARAAGVQHFVYSSVQSANRDTGIPHFDSKWQIEQAVRDARFPTFTIVRPVWFMDNFTRPGWFWPNIEKGQLALPLPPQTRLQMIAVEDIARYALMAFDRPDELNRAEIDIAGDEKTMTKTAAIISEAVGWEVEFVHVSLEEYRKSSPEMATMFDWFQRVGYDVDITGLTERYSYRPMTLREWAAAVEWPAAARR